jgi:uncharacterized protein (UPF0276 family)
MSKIFSTAACNLDANILGACIPLFEEERVEAIEWSFDALFKVKEVPDWFRELIAAFSKEGRLIGHGVFFSLFSGKWLPQQEEWLRHLKKVASEFHFEHITEHFGFMTGKDFHQGAPLTIPFTNNTLTIGRDRLRRIQEACECPVGLENLAFSYSIEEVKKHGYFLEQLLQPVNGFIILDLHNLYCQLHNFNISFDELIALYPLHLVREIHISGGSWDESSINPGQTIRRDTHDDAVPETVFELLEKTILRCPHLRYVVLEQLGNGLEGENSKSIFYNDFLRMEKMVQQNNQLRSPDILQSFLPVSFSTPATIAEDEILYQQQRELSGILENASSYENAVQLLYHSSLAHSDWQIEQWEPQMIETAVKIAQKWKQGW